MTDDKRAETYTLGYGQGSMEWMTSRTADGHGAFLLPFLQPGMRLLDCGCGPGTLTIGFARHVAPGDAIGLDRDTAQTETVATVAGREGVANLRFETGDVYALPYPDASFDVTFASAVLGSVADAERVVREMLRVLKPGGVIALKEFDHGGDLIWPQTPVIAKSYELYLRLRAKNGHEPQAGRQLNAYLSQNACRVEHLQATYTGRYTPEQLEMYVERNNKLFDEVLAQQYYDYGWTTPDEMAESVDEWRRFAREPGSVFMSAWVEAVGIKR